MTFIPPPRGQKVGLLVSGERGQPRQRTELGPAAPAKHFNNARFHVSHPVKACVQESQDLNPHSSLEQLFHNILNSFTHAVLCALNMSWVSSFPIAQILSISLRCAQYK